MIELKNVNYQYKGDTSKHSLKGINLTIQPGEMVVLCGESGCGKTTLTRLFNGLIPHFYEGNLEGTVMINGQVPKKKTIQEVSRIVGSVFQNPRAQFFSTNTTSELAFACENAGLDKETILRRIACVNNNLNFTNLLDQNIFKLSGGEKQKIACGSVSVADNEIYVLDEPSSNLDLKAITELQKQLQFWKKQGKTVIIAEHRLHYLKDIVDRMIYLKEGKIEQEFCKEEISGLTSSYLNHMGLRSIFMESIIAENETALSESNLELRKFSFTYNKGTKPKLTIPNVLIPKGSVTGVVGFNGAGKSTFAHCFCGLEKRCKGDLTMDGHSFSNKERLKKSYIVMQDVNHQLFTESVLDEVLLSQRKESEEEAKNYLLKVNVENFSERHPLSLSGGQKQRVAIASALASESEWIFFDEPTSGLDYRHMQEVAKCLRELADMGKTIFVISHDFELVAKCCNYYLHIKKGEIIQSGILTTSSLKNLQEIFV